MAVRTIVFSTLTDGLSGIADIRDFKSFALEGATAFTGSTMIPLGAHSSDGPFTQINYGGAAVEIAVSASARSLLFLTTCGLEAVPFVRFKAGDASTAATQAAARTVRLYCK